jgi:DNA primase
MEKINLEEIKSRIVLSEFARDHLGCQVSSNKTMCCHIHHEKTPSLNFNDEKKFYYCFGCHKSGDVFSLTQEIKNYSFLEAIKFVANTIGIKIESSYNLLRESNQFKEKKEILFNIMNDLSLIFHKDLMNNIHALNYLTQRGIKKELIVKFQLGYSGKSNKEIIDMIKKKYSENYRLLFDSGVFKKSSYSEDFYNILQNRIIFPIFDKFSRVIAFSGRIFNENTNGPKYINCSDSLIFKKSENLYGENLAIKNIKSSNQAIIVEGNIDVIMMHQEGFTNVVASLGTAISETQLKYLWSSCDEIKCIFDGDLAGYKAMISTIEKGLQNIKAGKFLSFVNLPKEADPASFIVKNGSDILKKLINNSKFSSEMILRIIWSKYKNPKIEHIAAIKKDLIYYLNLIKDKIIKDEFQTYFEKKLKIISNFIEKKSNDYFYINKESNKKINIKKPIYEKIFCFAFVFLNKFDNLEKLIDYESLKEIYIQSQSRQMIEKMLNYSFKEIFTQNFQKKYNFNMNFIKNQFKKENLIILKNYIEIAEQEIQDSLIKENFLNIKKLWLKNVDLSIIQSKISNIEFQGNPDYETNRTLNLLKEKELKIKQIIEN